ncbi:MAG TPA: hypothetical protein DDX54_05825, partial [Rhodospirillaceae bacterium]|nr:hypothetical protein [Rhodospirillaceae bacterium]
SSPAHAESAPTLLAAAQEEERGPDTDAALPAPGAAAVPLIPQATEQAVAEEGVPAPLLPTAPGTEKDKTKPGSQPLLPAQPGVDGAGEETQPKKAATPHREAPTLGANGAAQKSLPATQGEGVEGALPTGASASTSGSAHPGPGALTHTAPQGQNSQAQTAGAAQPHGAGFSAPLSSGAAQAVAVTLQKAAEGGEGRRFVLQLDPPELGRVEVRLDFGHDKSVKAVVLVDKPDTYTMLQRDAGSLERILQNTGLDTSGGLQFSLAQGGQKGHEEQDGSGPSGSLSGADEAASAGETAALHWWDGDRYSVVV